MNTVYSKPQSNFIGVADDTSIGGGVLRMTLNRDDFTVEHSVNVGLTQAFSVAPNSIMSGLYLIEKIEIETERGIEFTTTGTDIAALNEITGSTNSERVTLGLNSTMEFFFSVHSAMHGASHDLLTAIESGQRSKYNLILTFAKDVSAAMSGGTMSGVPTYTVSVEAKTYPVLTGVGEIVGGAYEGIASLVHRVVTNSKPGNSTGQQQPIQLSSAGALLRFLQLVTWDTTGALPVLTDNVVESVRLVSGGREVFNSTFKNMQRRNESSRNITRINSGKAFIDYGDDVNEWLDMGDVKDARLYLTVAANAPASYEIRTTEDFVAQN